MLLFGSVVADASTATCINVRVTSKKTQGGNGGCWTQATRLAAPDTAGVPEAHTLRAIGTFVPGGHLRKAPESGRFPDQDPSPDAQLAATIGRHPGPDDPPPPPATDGDHLVRVGE